MLTVNCSEEALDYIDQDTFDVIILEPEISNEFELELLCDFMQVKSKSQSCNK